MAALPPTPEGWVVRMEALRTKLLERWRVLELALVNVGIVRHPRIPTSSVRSLERP